MCRRRAQSQIHTHFPMALMYVICVMWFEAKLSSQVNARRLVLVRCSPPTMLHNHHERKTQPNISQVSTEKKKMKKTDIVTLCALQRQSTELFIIIK